MGGTKRCNSPYRNNNNPGLRAQSDARFAILMTTGRQMTGLQAMRLPPARRHLADVVSWQRCASICSASSQPVLNTPLPASICSASTARCACRRSGCTTAGLGPPSRLAAALSRTRGSASPTATRRPPGIASAPPSAPRTLPPPLLRPGSLRASCCGMPAAAAARPRPHPTPPATPRGRPWRQCRRRRRRRRRPSAAALLRPLRRVRRWTTTARTSAGTRWWIGR